MITWVLRLIFSIVFLVLFVGSVLALGLHFWAAKSDLNEKFQKGKVPEVRPNGLYHGEVELIPFKTPWKGKRFDAKNNTGVNMFRNDDENYERYPFKTYTGKSLTSKNEVVVIDYNTPGSPLWLRPLEDEIVLIATDNFLGKIHLRLPLGYALILGFFRLER